MQNDSWPSTGRESCWNPLRGEPCARHMSRLCDLQPSTPFADLTQKEKKRWNIISLSSPCLVYHTLIPWGMMEVYIPWFLFATIFNLPQQKCSICFLLCLARVPYFSHGIPRNASTCLVRTWSLDNCLPSLDHDCFSCQDAYSHFRRSDGCCS